MEFSVKLRDDFASPEPSRREKVRASRLITLSTAFKPNMTPFTS